MKYRKMARVIATLDCLRACPYCVNYQAGMLARARPLTKLTDLAHFDEIIITGGEPAWWPGKLTQLATRIAQVNPSALLYLYLADYTDVRAMWRLLGMFDGAHYTLHADATELDVNKFAAFQDIVRWNGLHLKQSFRLMIVDGMAHTLIMYPKVWTRIEKKPYESDCNLPEGETLFRLSEELWNQ